MVEDPHLRPLKLKWTKHPFCICSQGMIWTHRTRPFPAKISRIKTYSCNAASSLYMLCLAAVVKKGTFTAISRPFPFTCNSSNEYTKYFTSLFLAIYSNYSVIHQMYTDSFSYVNTLFASQL